MTVTVLLAKVIRTNVNVTETLAKGHNLLF